MIWIQGSISFALWILYGWRMRAASAKLHHRLSGWSRSRRVILASAGLLLSLSFLFFGLWAIAELGGLGHDGMSLWGWFGVSILGLAFIHVQVVSAAAMITLLQSAVTRPCSGSSIHQDTKTS